jgi:pheromone shutdown protein TraB
LKLLEFGKRVEMKSPNQAEANALPHRAVNWVRAIYLTAICGAVFWAVAVHFAAKLGGSPTLISCIAAAAMALIISGLLTKRYTKSVHWQSISVALIAAPATGLIPLIPLGLIELVSRLA